MRSLLRKEFQDGQRSSNFEKKLKIVPARRETRLMIISIRKHMDRK